MDIYQRMHYAQYNKNTSLIKKAARPYEGNSHCDLMAYADAVHKLQYKTGPQRWLSVEDHITVYCGE